MPITDPQAITYTNEVIRSMAERMRALKVDIDAATTTWFSGINTTMSAGSAEIIADGREDHGVSRLTGSDATALLTQMLAIQTQLNVEGVVGVISKPCVRTLVTGS